MTVYLDADCALTALIGANFLEPKEWKQENSKNYTAIFYHGKTNGTLCFSVTVENRVHRISALYMKNLERQYRIDLSIIVDKCTIK
jgi:hypothetical protein